MRRPRAGKRRRAGGIKLLPVAIGVAILILLTVSLTVFTPTTKPPSGVQTTIREELTGTVDGGVVALTGAGATFPYPLISKWINEYHKLNPTVQINYQSIGSGGGIRQHIAKTVDFGASDKPLNEAQMAAAEGTLHLPITIGAIAVVYNLPGVESGLKLTGPLLADIFLGKVDRWDDPAIVSLNPELQLPDEKIQVVHRSDGSGTTYVFTDYLSRVSPEWADRVGAGTAVEWPTGIGAAGNEGVAGILQSTSYTIGYVELAYAIQTGMSYAALQNQVGRFVVPSLESAKAAAAALSPALPPGDGVWEKVSLLNAPGDDSYPIVSFSYIILYRDLAAVPGMTRLKAKVLVEFLWWAVHEGQKYAAALHYVELPPEVVALNEETLRLVTFKGEPLLGS
jgi:phosphate transport system permease protein/phosphate transport system substrate-binding protein